jgi:hypothetical protein
MGDMRASILAALALVLVPASAAAKQPKLTPVIPVGNSGANQYVENVPTAGGNRPAIGIAQQESGGGSGSTGSTGATASVTVAVAPLTHSTQRALAHQGSDGRRTAAIAKITAPVKPVVSSGTGTASGTPVADKSEGFLSAMFRSLTGGGENGGGQGFLPLMLILTVVGFGALALRRRRTN